jgi:acetyltransferase-like isoleucine patch superfamily enzyme
MHDGSSFSMTSGQVYEPPGFAERLQVEAPATLGGASFYGECWVGFMTGFADHTAAVHSARIGRYCSVAKGILIGASAHATDYLTTHPIGGDPLGAGFEIGYSDEYQAMTCTEVSRPISGSGVMIHNDVWIGANAIILAGVTVETGAIIGAGAMVGRHVKAYEIVVGSPARHARYRFEGDIRKRLLETAWWDYDLSFMPRRDFSDVNRFLDDLEAAIAKGMPKLSPTVVQYGN